MARSLQRQRRSSSESDKTLLLLLLLPPICFYIGYSNSIVTFNHDLLLREGCAQNNDGKKKDEYEHRFADLLSEVGKDPSIISHKIFPPSTSDYAAAMLHVSKEDLIQAYDFGHPFAPFAHGSDAIIIYNTPKSIPDDLAVRHDAYLGKHEREALEYEKSLFYEKFPYSDLPPRSPTQHLAEQWRGLYSGNAEAAASQTKRYCCSFCCHLSVFTLATLTA